MDNRPDKKEQEPQGQKKQQHTKDPLHGITLEQIVNSLVDYFGWAELGLRVNIKCFNSNPSVQSSLKFLRKTPWAREKVEGLYMYTQREKRRQRNSRRPNNS